MTLSFETLETYAAQQTSAEPEVLRRLREETYKTQSMPQMIAGPLQGLFLTLLTRILGAKRILEIGTFVGYSALCFARALPEDGEIITIDLDPGIQGIAQKYFAQSPTGERFALCWGMLPRFLRDYPALLTWCTSMRTR